jgi:hypothetical protein
MVKLTPIELSDRHQVQDGDEEPDPASECHGREMNDRSAQFAAVRKLSHERKQH